MGERFTSINDVATRLEHADYLPSPAVARTVFLADRLDKAMLVEGPAGTGKTELAKALAVATNAKLLRLQCYEGLDEAKALYEWNYKKQLLRIQVDRDQDRVWNEIEADIFSEGFLLERPLLQALRSPVPLVLLIDEIDRVESETEALLLEVLSDFQISIPELGTVTSTRRPLVVLTSNNTRDLSEALKRRCLFLHLPYPAPEREQMIIEVRVPEISSPLAAAVAELVAKLRQLDLKKRPSISETLDWARTLVHLGADDLGPQMVEDTLNVLLKYEGDVDEAHASLLPQLRRAASS